MKIFFLIKNQTKIAKKNLNLDKNFPFFEFYINEYIKKLKHHYCILDSLTYIFCINFIKFLQFSTMFYWKKRVPQKKI